MPAPSLSNKHSSGRSPEPSRLPVQGYRISLPADLRKAMLPDLPSNVTLAPGRIEITAGTPSGLVEVLTTLAMVMQNDSIVGSERLLCRVNLIRMWIWRIG